MWKIYFLLSGILEKVKVSFFALAVPLVILIQTNHHAIEAYFRPQYYYSGTSQVALVVKKPPSSAGDIREAGSIPGSGRSPGRRHGNPLQYSCLQNPMDRGAWWATAHSVAKCGARLKQLRTHYYSS